MVWWRLLGSSSRSQKTWTVIQANAQGLGSCYLDPTHMKNALRFAEQEMQYWKKVIETDKDNPRRLWSSFWPDHGLTWSPARFHPRTSPVWSLHHRLKPVHFFGLTVHQYADDTKAHVHRPAIEDISFVEKMPQTSKELCLHVVQPLPAKPWENSVHLAWQPWADLKIDLPYFPGFLSTTVLD